MWGCVTCYHVAALVIQNKVHLKVRPHAADVTAGDFHQLQHLLSIPTRTAGTFALLSAALLIKQMDKSHRVDGEIIKQPFSFLFYVRLHLS